jgi:hypothetical protein
MPPAFADGVALFNAGLLRGARAFEELLDDARRDERWDLLIALVRSRSATTKWTSGAGAARMCSASGSRSSARFPT